jgi:serine O-acetyltransferase
MDLISKKKFKEFVKADLFRHTGSATLKSFFITYLRIPGFRYMFWFRCVNYFKNVNVILAFYAKLRLRHYSFKYGIMIPSVTKIDKGFYIGHFSCIVVSPDAIIGKNVNISQGVTIGRASRGEKEGAAIISDEVYIGPGAKIVGKIIIGNNVAIGANAVVTKDVPPNAVVGGIPAKIISMHGAEGYINKRV